MDAGTYAPVLHPATWTATWAMVFIWFALIQVSRTFTRDNRSPAARKALVCYIGLNGFVCARTTATADLVYVHIYVCVHLASNGTIRVCTYTHTNAFTYAFVYACVYVGCVFVHVQVHVYVYVGACARICIRICMYLQMLICIDVYVYVYDYV